MKKLLFVIAIFCAMQGKAQNYQITFTGTGATTTVNSVRVDNLTSGTSINLGGIDILLLTVTTGVNSPEYLQSSGLKIYPNPMTEFSTLEIFPPAAGNAVITICESTGKPLFQVQYYLENLRQDFKISGLKNGFYLVIVKGNNYQFSGKLVSSGEAGGKITIGKVNSGIQTVDEKPAISESKGTQALVSWPYTAGDRLKYTGASGIYSTVVTDIPTSDKIINFNFTACTDGDNRNYPVVEIGTQWWMAENLKTTKYNDGTSIPNVTVDLTWAGTSTGAYCDYNNTATNSDTYGRLYNWYTAASTNAKNVCPVAWHTPTDADWSTLDNYMIYNGYNYNGFYTGNYYAKALTSTINWVASVNEGAPGNSDYPGYRNKSGYTALPGGIRINGGSYTYLGEAGYWWSATAYDATQAWYRDIYSDYVIVSRSFYPKNGGFSIRCVRNFFLQTLTTTAVSSIGLNTAVSGGNIVNTGGLAVTARGVCWSTTTNPTIDLSTKTNDGPGDGSFTSTLTALTSATLYYVRAYATSSAGTDYGNELTFRTANETGTVSDIDGNTYNTVKIGQQWWMAENLKATKYNDGTAIPNETGNAAWSALTTGAYCDYSNTPANSVIYGRLYNWWVAAATNPKNVCPTGWHVSSDPEWTTLAAYLGGTGTAGGSLKETGTTHWVSPNGSATNQTGFTALPGGFRSNGGGSYLNMGINGFWWSSTFQDASNSLSRSLNSTDGALGSSQYGNVNGFSVRCIQD
jgi:uncharacterized protein (TIGR02145 family)